MAMGTPPPRVCLIKPTGNLSDMVIFILNAFFAGQLRSTDF